MFGSFGLPELLVILVIVIALFGAGRISGVGRALGQSVRGFREEVRTDDEEDESKGEDGAESDAAAAESVAASESTASSEAPSQVSSEKKEEGSA